MNPKEFQSLIKKAEGQLKDAGIDSAAAEVEIILCHLLSVERIDLYVHGYDLINDRVIGKFHDIIARRMTRYPLQYILGETHFYGRRFLVDPDVMIPTPETELLCDLAINHIKNQEYDSATILDIGTGAGVIAVTLACERPECWITATDISQAALAMARKNAALHEAMNNITFLKSNLFSAISQSDKFDFILSNPPYIAEKEYPGLSPEVKAEPKISLLSGVEGMDMIMRIIDEAPQFLNENGRILFEIGYNQGEKVADLTEKNPHFRSLSIIKDLNDIDRVVILST